MHRRCLAGEADSSPGDFFVRADGRIQRVRWSAWPWIGDEGEVGGIILMTEVGSERVEPEVSHLASVVTHSSDAIIVKTLDSIVVGWNEAATRLLGYRADEMIGQSIDKIVPREPAR